MSERAFVDNEATHVFVRELDRRYPLIVRGEGVWLEDAAGHRYLDAVSGGSMTATLGAGVREIVDAAARQAYELSYLYNQQFSSPAQERLAAELVGVAPAGLDRVHFVTGGAEANETALRLAYHYHVERGQPGRTRIVSQAQAYHGPTMATLGLTGRPGLWAPYQPFVTPGLYVPPSTWRFDPSGQGALDALDAHIGEHGADSIAAFFCEPISAAALPAHSPPDAFWHGLAERRERHGFLIVLDEVVTGMGRTGTWFASDALPLVPDIVTTAKGLGAATAPSARSLCGQHVYDAFAAGSRAFEHGHTWDGAPLSCAVGLAVIDHLRRHALVERVREHGPRLRDASPTRWRAASSFARCAAAASCWGSSTSTRGTASRSSTPTSRVARRIDEAALERGLLLYSTQPTRDGYAGDQTLLAPAFVTPEAEQDLIVERLADTVHAVAREVQDALVAAR